MKLGVLLDNKEDSPEFQTPQQTTQEATSLTRTAHLANVDQAKTLLPILNKVKERQRVKADKLADVEKKLEEIRVTERY